MRLPVIPVKGNEKWELLSKIIDKLEFADTLTVIPLMYKILGILCLRVKNK